MFSKPSLCNSSANNFSLRTDGMPKLIYYAVWWTTCAWAFHQSLIE